jgi:hypothetical protein
MKGYIILFFSVTALFSCSLQSKKVEEVKARIELGKSYGPSKVNVENAISVEDMLSDFNTVKGEKEYTFKAKLAEICTKAGCWVNIEKPDGGSFMVRFKDHFVIPTDTKIGSEAFFRGIAYWDTVSVEMLQHFAEDAGKSKEVIAEITKANYELGFECDGIVIQK